MMRVSLAGATAAIGRAEPEGGRAAVHGTPVRGGVGGVMMTALRGGCYAKAERARMAAEPSELAAGVRGGMTDRERLLRELRPVSFAIAYRMLGSVSEA